MKNAFRILAAFAVPWFGAAPSFGSEPIDVGSRRELFVDSFLIEKLDGARRVLHRPVPREVVMVFDRPWESGSPGYATVLRDEDRYRLYYRATHTPPGYGKPQTTARRQVTCYAESRDGIHWTRPDLGLVEFHEATRNNIMWDRVGSHNFTPCKNVNPHRSPAAAYLAVGRGRPLADEPSPYQHGLYVLQSADGVDWQEVREEPVITNGKFDSQNLVFWDAVGGMYRAYWRDSRRGSSKIPNGRDVRTAVSDDAIHWNELGMLKYEPGRRGTADKDGPAHQFYTNVIQPYHRAPHFFLGFPKRYIDHGWTYSTEQLPELAQRRGISQHLKRAGTAITDSMFMTSRDGLRFDVWPQAFVRPGIGRAGNWFYGDSGVALGIVETKSTWGDDAPNELSLYVSENTRIEAPGQLRRYTLRLDGFVSVNAPLDGGRLLSKLLKFEGDRLEINYATSAGGTVRVELQNADGKSIDGFSLGNCDPIYGDQVERVVTWQRRSKLGDLAGKPIRLLVELKDADLYSLRFPHLESGDAR